MLQFKKIYIIALMVIIYNINTSFGRRRKRSNFIKRDSEEYKIKERDCRRAYLVARTTEKLCNMNINSLDDYSNELLEKKCSSSGCMSKVIKAYNNFESICYKEMVENRDMLLQHIKDLNNIICKKNGNNYCLSDINSFIHSNIKSKNDLGMCENSCISDIYYTIGKGIVTVPVFLRNSIIHAHLLCSKVPGKSKYCIEKLKDFREESNYEKKMNVYCNSLCVQKTLWKEQSEYDLTYNLNSSLESIISNFTDSACLYYKENRCGEFLLKILNNDYGCSGLRYPRVFPFSGNYTICNKEVNDIIKDYGPCVNSLFSNKSGDWLNLYKEISRYSKTRRLQDYTIFEEQASYEETFNRTYHISNFNWTWYQSNDRAVSSYIINSIGAHLGITPSMISGQGFNDYTIMIKGLTKKQRNELDGEHSMALTMFSGQISVKAIEDSSKGGFTIDGAFNVIPSMFTIFFICIHLTVLLYLI